MSILRQRLPTILGLLILIAGVVVGVYLVNQGGTWSLRADPQLIPKQVKISNLTDNSFVVSWVTDKKALGFVKYGTTPSLETTARDERDRLGNKTTPYKVHYVKISNLQPETKYYFKIGSGKELFGDTNGEPYQVTTAPSLATVAPTADTAYGRILKADGAAAVGVVVYLHLANSTTLSSLSKADGKWVIPLSTARTQDLSSYLTYDREASIEEIFVQGGDLGTATATVTTKNDSPVPDITLGRTYDFRQTATISPTPSQRGKFSLESITATPSSSQKTLTIVNPEENEEIATQKPEIRGTGPSGKKLKIIVESSETFTGEVIIDEDGEWHWSPPDNLSPGKHTVIVTLEDGTTLSRSFTVLAAGTEDLPAFTATPSGEATPSPTSSPTPTPLVATASPTPSVSTSSATPTVPPRTSLPSTSSGITERAGYLTPTVTFVILGIVLTLSGLILNFKSRLYG